MLSCCLIFAYWTFPVGLLINFHVVSLRTGIRRMVNNYREPIGFAI